MDDPTDPLNPPQAPPQSAVVDDSASSARAPGGPARKAPKGIGAIATGLGFLALKFKSVLAVLMQFKFIFVAAKLFALSWTFLLSLWIYVMLFGWRFAIVILLLLLAHEMGHYAAFRAYGLPVRLPVFIPLMGAMTAGAMPQDLEQDAYIALAGPLTGLGLAAACYAIGLAFNDRFWFACADVSAFLNLFNMIPTPPFDGGRVVNAIWPALWIVGFALFIGVSIVLHFFVIFTIIIGLLGLFAIVPALRGRVDPRAANMTNGARLRVSVWYLATLLGLILLMGQSHALAGNSAMMTL